LAKLDASNAEAGLKLAEAQLDSAKKMLEEAKPPLALAERELERFQKLKSTGAASELDILRAESAEAAAKARLARLQADIAVAERTVTQFQQQLDDTVIRAPFAGVVTTKDSQPGEMISPMSSGGFTRTGICTVVDMTSLEIEVDVNESYINRVQPAQPAEATLDAYADWRIPAKVIAIIPTADRQKATVKVRVGFDKLDPRILPEMGVKVSFLTPVENSTAGADTKAAKKTLTIPAKAVTQENGRQIVWVVKDRVAERRAITADQRTDGKFTVAAGLSAGERVVTDAPSGLADGGKVTEKK
jgi:RND family efflux transporter MFP subunit